jgi:hypothetical protein
MGSDLVGVAPARGERIGRTLVPDDRWEIVEPLLPIQQARPQGGDTASVDDSACSPRFVHVLTPGCAWRHHPVDRGKPAPSCTCPPAPANCLPLAVAVSPANTHDSTPVTDDHTACVSIGVG